MSLLPSPDPLYIQAIQTSFAFALFFQTFQTVQNARPGDSFVRILWHLLWQLLWLFLIYPCASDGQLSDEVKSMVTSS